MVMIEVPLTNTQVVMLCDRILGTQDWQLQKLFPEAFKEITGYAIVSKFVNEPRFVLGWFVLFPSEIEAVEFKLKWL